MASKKALESLSRGESQCGVFPTFGIPVFGIPVFGTPTVGFPAFGIPAFGKISRIQTPLNQTPLRLPPKHFGIGKGVFVVPKKSKEWSASRMRSELK